MPRDRPKQRRRRKPIHPLPRQREHKPVSRPFQMGRERILSQLHDLIGSCEDLFAEHGDSCACESCCVVSNFVGTVRLFRMILEIS